MSDYEKIVLVGMYVEGNVEHWYMDMTIAGREAMSWDTFVKLFLDKFSKDNEIIGEFNKLRQKGGVEDYIDKFSELKSFMLQRNKFLDDFYIDKFSEPVKRLNKEELDELYTVGHKCKKIFAILLTEHEDCSSVPIDDGDSEKEVSFGVSMHALKGQVPTDTIKLIGKVKNNNLTILVDSGSTHSFIDLGAAKKINCEVEITNPLQVTVAGGGQIECNSKCPRLEWEMARHCFAASVRIFPLGGYDMVMGVDLMRKLGPIMLDYDYHTITFDHKGQRVVVPGIQPDISVKMITGRKMNNLLKKRHGTIFQCLSMLTTSVTKTEDHKEVELEQIIIN
ncbi:unnamed protein product [Cuscuta epithymum]|uniref:Ty3 transposon capsid-like protein domain-containing protein n=1 Tax=Cuscuta epithymum TaxID=186058 RepID=A0AAV0G3R8_9ASTE|nr:unnamed protein product [Cuscuta epithymum]CAH9142379.1 unnamed protein product [Cuscuta epithymum]